MTLPASAAGDSSWWRVGWANDEFMGSDNQFTNGVFVQKVGSVAESLESAGDTPAFGQRLAAWMLPDRPGLAYRESWTLAQNMQTPDAIGVREPIFTDVPYVGMLGWLNTFVAFDDRELSAFQTLLGWVGDATQAKHVQRAAHRLTGATTPDGWRNQLSNEPLINAYAMRKRKFAGNGWMDAAWSASAGLGNFFTYAQAGLEFRFGDRPPGFAPVFTATGHDFDYDARLRGGNDAHFYLSTAMRVRAEAFALPRDGNLFRNDDLWTENERIDPRSVLGEVVIGVHFERPAWGVHFSLHLATDAVETESGPGLEDPKNNYGMVVVERRF